MLKKTITYTDYDGNERTEDFYFNLSKAELADMNYSVSGGLSEMIKRIVNAQDLPELVKLFKEIILKAYGVKSPDGRRFVKDEELTKEFTQTEAFSDLYMELSTNTDAAIEFINKVIPSDLASELAKSQNSGITMLPSSTNA